MRKHSYESASIDPSPVLSPFDLSSERRGALEAMGPRDDIRIGIVTWARLFDLFIE